MRLFILIKMFLVSYKIKTPNGLGPSHADGPPPPRWAETIVQTADLFGHFLESTKEQGPNCGPPRGGGSKLRSRRMARGAHHLRGINRLGHSRTPMGLGALRNMGLEFLRLEDVLAVAGGQRPTDGDLDIRGGGWGEKEANNLAGLRGHKDC